MGEEQATEDLPEKIRRVAKAVGLVWSEDYSRYAHLLLVDAADEIERLRADHDRRVTELLEANNREVERRRRVEADLAMAVARIEDMLMGDDGQAWQEARKFLRDLERRRGGKP